MKSILMLIGLMASLYAFAEAGGYDPSAGGYDPSIALKLENDAKAQKQKEFEIFLKQEAPENLKALSKRNLCALYGKALRDEELRYPFAFKEAKQLIIAEAKKKKLRIDVSMVKKGNIRLGINQCTLYAAWGEPNDENESVGSWGVHIQHIYGSGQYVYTENGIVRSWQD